MEQDNPFKISKSLWYILGADEYKTQAEKTKGKQDASAISNKHGDFARYFISYFFCNQLIT